MKQNASHLFFLLLLTGLAVNACTGSCTRSSEFNFGSSTGQPQLSNKKESTPEGYAVPTIGVNLQETVLPSEPGCPALTKDNPDDEPIDFDDLEGERKARLNRIAAADEVDIIVLVDASGPGGIGDDGDTWRMTFSAVRWRHPGGPIDKRILYLNDKEGVSQKRLDEKMAGVSPYQVLKLRVRLDPQSAADPSEPRVDGQLVKIIDGKYDDPELTDVAKKLKMPITVNDRYFGTLTLDRSLDEYSGVKTLGTGTYGLSIDCTACDDPSQVLTEENKKRLRCIESSLSVIADSAANDLLDIFNSNWNEDKPLTKAQFLSRIRLTDVSLGDDLITLYFDDGGLFLGHLIEVHVDGAKNEIWEAGIAG